MIRQLMRLTFSAAVIGLLALLLSPSAKGRQVGVKAEPPPKPPPKTNAPNKPTKRPVAPRAVPKGTKPKVDEPLTSTYSVLSLIEKYTAPPRPKSVSRDRESYDERRLSGGPVPATLADVLVCDIWQRVTKDLGLSPNPKEVSQETIKQAMNIYLTKPWANISGYRPWTHWNFIHGLNESERETLARDVARYIAKNGVRDVKK